jgi:hypothetical protein
MEYSHSDRLEGFRLLYMTLADEQKDFYNAKDQWESVSDGLDEAYFWTAVEDMYQNDLLQVNELQLSGSNEFKLASFSVEDYNELNKIRVHREWDLDENSIEVFSDHFKRHDQPDPDDYTLGSSKCRLEVDRNIEKGDKTLEYLLENDTKQEEASLRLEVEFNVPAFSPEIEEVFLKYAENYLNKIERQEVNTLRRRPEKKSVKSQKSAVG